VRKATQNIVGVLSLGVLATSWSLGQAADTGLSLETAPQPAATNNTDAPAEPAAKPSATPATPAEPGTAPSQSASQSSAPTKAPAPAPTKQPAAASVSQTGAAVPYKYGVIQLEVVKSGSSITAVNLIQSSTKGPDWAVVPGMLAEAAVSANGSNFGNVSGATFTTQAFKQALESALGKF
jgi:uncharacterized protein with FMN-binding domain